MLLGRAAEQDAALRVLAAAGGPTLAVTVIDGDQGMGRSAMLAWLADVAGTAGWRVLTISVLPEHDRSRSLRDELFDGLVHELGRGSVDGIDDDPAAAATADDITILELLSSITDDEPALLICIDDAHHADKDSRDLLVSLARRAGATRAALVMTLRATATDDAQLLALQRLTLGPLPVEAARALYEAHWTDQAPPFDEQLRNPLAITLVAKGYGTSEGGGPSRVLAAAIADSLRHYPPATRQALEALAIAGPVDSDTQRFLFGRLGLSDDVLSPALADGVIDLAGRFRHQLTRSATSAATEHAAEIHAALRDCPTISLERRLEHGLRSTAPEADAVAAAEHAMQVSFEEARYDDAIRLADALIGFVNGDRAARLAFLAMRAAARMERFPLGATWAVRCRSHAADPLLRTAAMTGETLLALWSEMITIHEAIDRLARDLANAPEGDPALMAFMWGGAAGIFLRGDITTGVRLMTRLPEALAGLAEASVLRITAGGPAAITASSELRAAVAADEAFATHSLDGVLSWLESNEGNWDAYYGHALAAVEEARRSGQFSYLSEALSILALAELHRGNGRIAYGVALTAIERSNVIDPADVGDSLIVLAAYGDPEVVTWVDTLRRRPLVPLDELQMAHCMGLYLLSQERFDDAADELRLAWKTLVQLGAMHPGALNCRGDIAEAAALAGDSQLATVVIQELSAEPSSNWALGVAARARGTLGEPDAFAESVALLGDDPWEHARTRLAWARAASSGNDVVTAVEQAAQARVLFTAQGLVRWAANAATIERACTDAGRSAEGTSATSSAAAPPNDPLAGLTNRERSVALAVSRGLSNKHLATELQISRKTVEAHLQQVFRKLNVESRTQLTALVLTGCSPLAPPVPRGS